ncbi:PAS domain S-box protein [Pedobacter sp. MW01-1-1]|uniref:PAS domain S-box protein n=1 Tax=Pedobacter sp. MW01-1-1 TaxID=3383027 RepID=UPI003FF09706
MSVSPFQFSKEQLNRLFPFYILLNSELIITDCGSSLAHQIDCIGQQLEELFVIEVPKIKSLNFNGLKELNTDFIRIRVKSITQANLSGNIEVLGDSDQIVLLLNNYNSQKRETEPALLELEGIEDSEDQLKILSRIAEININTIIITDWEDKITWVNKSFTEMTGYSFKEVIGKRPEDLLHGPATSRETLDYLNHQVENGQAFNADIYNYAKSGKPYWARIKGQPIYTQHGELIGFFTLIEDFTKEKEVQELLDESENRFRTALERIGNVWEHDLRADKTSFSKKNKDFWGEIDDDTDVEALWWASIHPDDLHLVLANFRAYRSGEIDSHAFEYRFISPNGETKWILDRGLVTEYNEDSLPLRVVGTHTDITQIKKTEQELEQHVKQFTALAENVPGVIYEFEYRPDGTDGMRYVSPAVEREFGIPQDVLWNRNYIAPIDLERINQKQEYSRDTLKPFYDECEFTFPGKEPRWYAVNSSYSYTTNDGSKVFTGFIADITERKTVEESLRINEEKYRSILANMNLGMIELDDKGDITYANNSFCNMCEYSISEIIGKNGVDIFITKEEGRADALERRLKRKMGLSEAYELEIVNKQGEARWWLVSGAPRYTDKGEFSGSIGVFLDITDKKNQEMELIAARVEAEQLAQSKESFLANMSHEIRTPMNAIMNMANQLAKTKLQPEQEFYLETILNASKNLLVIINDVLDLSKIDAGKLTIENIGFNLVEVLQSALQVIVHKGEQKGLDLENNFFDENVAEVLIGDPFRLNQVLLNLMSNAVKFTDKGSVSLNCYVLEETEEAQTIRISVTDTGIGMDESFTSQMFDKFSQEHDSVSRKYGGTGLGMSISKNLVEQMGGEIFVESKKGEGSTISFVIQFEKGIGEDLPVKKVEKFEEDFLQGKKILVTDDNELNRLVASMLLLDYGATVLVAENGAIAIEMLEREDFDLVLMDIQMPVMDGYLATKVIREKDEKIPVIALTASAIQGERERCLNAGMNDYISKPINETEFLKVIHKWLLLTEVTVVKEEDMGIENERDLYDLSSIRLISKGREDFVKKMVDMFCEQLPSLVKEMSDAFHANDLTQMGALAHKLKSSIDHLNVFPLQRVIRSIETFGQENIADASLPQLIAEVEEVTEKVVSSLKEEFSGDSVV